MTNTENTTIVDSYNQAIEYLYSTAPMFQQKGKAAYKEGLDTTLALDQLFLHPHTNYRTIHVAGTNGKGSVSSMLAATLLASGYKVGLYTSPHLVDFRERIRVNGEMIPEQNVVDFVNNYHGYIEDLQPSFFEITTIMAFDYFAKQQVDVAVIEVGLGGRLDCTNIIQPELSIITNISLDHTDLLGDTLEKIANEKAGIIKVATPVVIGETQPETAPIFIARASIMNAPIIFADKKEDYQELPSDLQGVYQQKNKCTARIAIRVLRKLGFNIPEEKEQYAFLHVCQLSGLQGRWQVLNTAPLTVCDTGHNEGGYAYLGEQLKKQECNVMHIVFGMVSDKKRAHVLQYLPKQAKYYFCNAQIPRACPAEILRDEAKEYGLMGEAYRTVKEAFDAAKEAADDNDFIFIGGSNFVIAEIL